MRVASTAVSFTTHVIVVLAALWTPSARPTPPQTTTIFRLAPFVEPTRGSEVGGFPMPTIGTDVVVPPISIEKIEGFDAQLPRIPVGVPTGPGPVFAPGTPGGDGGVLDPSLVDELPRMLVGPPPMYPELLRQAGLQGRVVLEAVIDTLGHVERGSVVVVESTHPSFVAPAQQSLLKSLFRPARVRGMAVRVWIRVPIDFVLRDGRLMGR